MKPRGRVRFFVTLTSILIATMFVGALIYQTTFDTLRQSYRDALDRSIDQGVFLIDGFLKNQYALLSLYASAPSVQEGHFSDLPDWLKAPPPGGVNPKRLSIIDASGQGRASSGLVFDAHDRPYFLRAQAGEPNVEGPLVSRVDNLLVVVTAVRVPGDHPRATVVTASFDPEVFRVLLRSLQGLSGAEFTLSAPTGTIATTAGSQALTGHDLVIATRTLEPSHWTLTAKIRVSDLLQPIRNLLILVAALVLFGGLLILVFYLRGLRHRRDLDQLREDRTQGLRDAYEQIRKLAFHDTVTRLPNRNMVIRKLGESLQAEADLVVAVVALGRFRNLTTTFGLHFGDVVLRESTARLAAFGPTDQGFFLGRLGGSEFILLMPADRYTPLTLSSLLDLFEAPLGRDDLKLRVNVHIGACRLKEAGDTPEEVIKSAETALWAARDLGPHEACELDAAAVARRLHRAQLQKLLPGACERGEMEVYFQAQVNLVTGVVAGYEALLRWTNPELGPVAPADFIPVAEETGVIVSLGLWVLDRSIEFARNLLKEEIPAVVSVNVSPVQFLHHDFLHEVGRRVEASEVPARWMGLEITESALMEDFDQLRPALAKVMETGIKVSLDDFGTGYSSLNYIKDLPLNTLKIDMSFVQALEEDERAFFLIECIIDLAHRLGLVVVAEGLETVRQQELLGSVGCDLVQGFLTGKPLPAREHLNRVVR